MLHGRLQAGLLGTVLVVLELLIGAAALLLGLPGVVAAGEVFNSAALQLPDPLAYLVQQGPVVADQDQRAGMLHQPLAQPGHALGVQVGGGLVRQQDRRSRRQRARDAPPGALAAGQALPGLLGAELRGGPGVEGGHGVSL